MKRKIACFALLALVSASCKKMFDYSPYEAIIPQKSEYHGVTGKNLDLITRIDTTDLSTYKIALLSDNHYYYKELEDAVDAINNRKDILFTVVTGDITDQGLEREFILFHDQMAKLNKPYVTVIGNHDYLSSGYAVYKQMYGDYNYSFVFNGRRFVMFDDTFWESAKSPDFNWLQSTLNNNTIPNPIVFSHIPPYGDQFDDESEKNFVSILKKGRVKLSVHGHLHFSFFDRQDYNDGVEYLTVRFPDKRVYTELTINRDGTSSAKEISF